MSAAASHTLLDDRALPLFANFNIADVTGPFFLGFVFEFFGMGAVLVLSIQYFLSLSGRPPMPNETNRRLGIFKVGISLAINLVQSSIDLARGYEMFGAGFFDLAKLLRPSLLWSISPFLGIFPALITQAFLLRRTLLFIDSLAHLWPKLAHPLVKWIFGGLLGLGIIISAISASWVSWMLSTVGTMYDLGFGNGSPRFALLGSIWLATSTGVDIGVASVLCFELWWARRKLARKGGGMRQVVTSLILVTLHGGLAVTTLQMSALLLYRLNGQTAWCYMPILFLPKVYTITLILSLSLPQAQGNGPSPSHVFSLPTIATSHPQGAQEPRLDMRRASSPAIFEYRLSEVSPQPTYVDEGTLKKRQRTSLTLTKSKSLPGDRLSEVMKRGWRRSQRAVNWSLIGELAPTQHEFRPKESGKEWDEPVLYPLSRPNSAPHLSTASLGSLPEDRRPSLIPLLSSPATTTLSAGASTRRPSTLSYLTLPPMSATLPQFIDTSRSREHDHSPTETFSLPSPLPVAWLAGSASLPISPTLHQDPPESQYLEAENPFSMNPRSRDSRPPVSYPLRENIGPAGEQSQTSSVVSFSDMFAKPPPR